MAEKITEIVIPRKIVQNLLHHAQQTPEQEVCGLISSRDNTPYRSYPVKNNAPEPARFFNLDAQQQIQVMAKMRDNNEQLFAIYHSHPTAPAIPSNTDFYFSDFTGCPDLVII
jgi:proteasome lid subunit RPN8/RPN11